MNTHEYYMGLISRFVDGDLSAAEIKEMNEHIAECDECREFYDFCTAINVSCEDAPSELLENVMAEVKHETLTVSASKTRKKGLKFWLPRGGAAIAACFAVILVLRSGFMGGVAMDSAAVENASAPMAAGSSASLYNGSVKYSATSSTAASDADAGAIYTGDYRVLTDSVTEEADMITADSAPGSAPAEAAQSAAPDFGSGSGAATNPALKTDLRVNGTLSVYDDGSVEFVPDDDGFTTLEKAAGGSISRIDTEMKIKPSTGDHYGIFTVELFIYEPETELLTIYLAIE